MIHQLELEFFDKLCDISLTRFIEFWRLVYEPINSKVKRLSEIFLFSLMEAELFFHSFFFSHFMRIDDNGVYFGWYRRYKYVQRATAGWWWFHVFTATLSFVVTQLFRLCRSCLSQVRVNLRLSASLTQNEKVATTHIPSRHCCLSAISSRSWRE